MKIPQCHIGFSILSKAGNKSSMKAAMTPSNQNLLDVLPDDILFQILLHCGPKEVDESVKFVCRRLHQATSMSTDLWKAFCKMTGKSLEKSHANAPGKTVNRCVDPKHFCGLEITPKNNFYRQYYYSNPCVPLDFDSINEALKYCSMAKASPFPLADDERFYSDEASVVLMPGTYQERVDVRGAPLIENQPLKSITIRAAFPSIGAALVHYERQCINCDIKNQSAISVSTRIDDGMEETGISLTLSHLQILHSTPGADIWNGNTAIQIDGLRAQVHIDSCKIQSDSGRGIVVTNQAELQMNHSSIVNCAATGFYIGDWGSRAKIVASNIVSCGFGDITLRQPNSEEELEARDAIFNQFVEHSRTGQHIPRDQIEVVPPGHSGVYIESSMTWIEDTLISGNSLTGLSVVRSGVLNLSGSDVTGNGHGHVEEQIMIEDLHDVRDQVHRRVNIRGGLMEGPLANNYVSRKVRVVPHDVKRPLTLASLLH